MSFYPHAFEAPVEYHDVGSDKYAYTVLFVPDEIARELPLKEHPRLRISGEVSDFPIDASLTPVRGRWYILLSKRILNAVDARVGDILGVRFKVADQEAVDVPEYLSDALANHPAERALWNASTAGKRRGLAYRVAAAKTDPTRQKRVDEVFGILRGELDMRGKPVR
ncbi:MAG: YdeI/OmpD-associated family protein [Pseudomonadota bacterium]